MIASADPYKLPALCFVEPPLSCIKKNVTPRPPRVKNFVSDICLRTRVVFGVSGLFTLGQSPEMIRGGVSSFRSTDDVANKGFLGGGARQPITTTIRHKERRGGYLKCIFTMLRNNTVFPIIQAVIQ